MTQSSHIDFEQLPPLRRDRSFWGMTATQFFGAFNDNLFKQLVLLICVDQAARGGNDHQATAMALFAIPFVLFSGFGGYVADRTSKRRIVVFCKVAEIAVMLLGLAAFVAGQLNPDQELAFLFVVLFLMSTQSAMFGPAKYGILPEMVREHDLPTVNGVIQMTTFVAIIFGWSLAGYSKEWLGDRLWIASAACVLIAIVGTLTSLFVRQTPVAHPGLPFRPSALAINSETWKLLRHDRPLLVVLLISSLFWFIGGVVQPSVNAFGKLQMKLGDGRTSLLGACMGVGIAVGCVLAGKASQQKISFRLVRIGAWGIAGSLFALAWLGNTPPAAAENSVPESFGQLLLPATLDEFLARTALTSLGIFAGLFVVPLQVFMQARPPEDQKGRMIGTMNLVNWIGIVLSAGFLKFATATLAARELPINWIFPALATMMVPVAIFFRPHDEQLR